MGPLGLRVIPLLLVHALSGRAAAPVEGLVAPYRQATLSAPVASFIVDLKVREGDPVQAGQLLAQLYSRLEELELQRAKALLERREYEARGAKNLFDNRIIPEAKALESRLDLELARLSCETAAEQLRLRSVTAPIDGLVVEQSREVGEAVSPSQPLFRIMDLSKVFIVCGLKPEQTGRAAPGRKLTVRIPQLEGLPSFQAEVVFVAPHTDASGHFRLKLLADNPGSRIPAGLKALVELPD